MWADAWLNRGYCERAMVPCTQRLRSRMVPATGYETCAHFGPPDAYPVEFGNIGIFERLKLLLDLVIGLDVMPSPGTTCQAEQDGWVGGKSLDTSRSRQQYMAGFITSNSMA